MVVLDELSKGDSTCLLLMLNRLTGGLHDFVHIRADFDSANVVLKTIESGCGDADSQLSTGYAASDGVLRILVHDRGH